MPAAILPLHVGVEQRAQCVPCPAWGHRLPWPLLKWGTWALAGVFALVAMANAASSTRLEQFVFAPAALALALLATLVAGSKRPSIRQEAGRR